MKDGYDAFQVDPDARAASFSDRGAMMLQQRFPIGPSYVSADGLSKDRDERFLVFAHQIMVSRDSIKNQFCTQAGRSKLRDGNEPQKSYHIPAPICCSKRL
jgi:hypothetical protein